MLPGRGDNREIGARPVRSRCRKEQFFSTRYAATGKPGRRYSAMILKPGNLPSECTGIGSRITRYWSYDFPAPFDAPVLSCPFPLEEGFFNAPVPRVP